MMTRFNWLQDKWSFVGSNLMPGQTDGRRQRHCHDDDELSMIQAVFWSMCHKSDYFPIQGTFSCFDTLSVYNGFFPPCCKTVSVFNGYSRDFSFNGRKMQLKRLH